VIEEVNAALYNLAGAVLDEFDADHAPVRKITE
jgi:hypothetical protein